MKNPRESYNRWYDLSPEISDSFSVLNEMSLEYQQLMGQIIIIVTQRIKEQTPSGNGLTSLGSERVLGLMKSQHKRRAADKDKILYKAFTNMYLLGDTQRDLMAERFHQSMACTDEYQLVCQRLGFSANYREMGQLVSETLEKGLHAGEQYLINIGRYDKDSEKVFVVLRSQASEAASVIEVASTIPVEPLNPELEAAKKKARLKQDQGGMKIHRQDDM